MIGCVAALVLAVSAAGCNVLDPAPDATISKDETSLALLSGEELYLTNCAGCHGLAGLPSDTAIVKDIRDWPGTYGRFDSLLTDNGAGAMPNFPELDGNARGKLYTHLKTLHR